MPEKIRYKTRQAQSVLAYLQQRPGQHVTAAEVCAGLAAQGEQIGKVTVYRQLEHFVEQGLVAQYTVDNTSACCYVYTGAPGADECTAYHCKCEKCGALIHLQCGEVEHLRAHMQEHHGFALDPRRTVFYGVCAQCRAKGL